MKLIETEQTTYNGRIISEYPVFASYSISPRARAYTIGLENIGQLEFLLCGRAIQEKVGKHTDRYEDMVAPWASKDRRVLVHATNKKLLGTIVFSRKIDSIEAAEAGV